MGKRKAVEEKAPPSEEDKEEQEEAETPKSSKVLKKPASRTSASVHEEPLTEAALKKHDEQLKNQLKAGSITEQQFEESMGKDGMQRQWQNFAYARKGNFEVDNGFKELSKLGRGAQQNSKKRMLLFAWLKDPSFGSSYMSVMTSLEFNKKTKKQLSWLTWKQTLDKHGSEEAVSMVKAGTLVARRNPQDRRFWQFLSLEDSMEMSMELKKQVTGTRTGKVSSAHLDNYEQAALSELDESMIEDILSGKNTSGLELKELKAIKNLDKDKGKEKEEDEA
jgi:hypothetical protein